jgi:hypothetical protein
LFGVNTAVWTEVFPTDIRATGENGGEKVGHGSGGMSLLRAA